MLRASIDWQRPAIDRRLRALWAAGLSAAAIARRLHTTRNAVIGRVTRLGLRRPEQPIRREAECGAPCQTVVRAPTITLAPLAGGACGPAPAYDGCGPAPAYAGCMPVPRARGCQYPLWDNSDRPDHRYCDAPVATGNSYCLAHYALCWVRPPAPPRAPGGLAGEYAPHEGSSDYFGMAGVFA